MKAINTAKARQDFYNLMDEVISTSQSIQILGKHGRAVLVSIDDWNAIQETLYLLSIPNMREELLKGKNSQLDKRIQEDGIYR